MAFRIKRGNFSSRGTTGSQSITGLGFKPKAIMMFQRDANTSAVIQSIGFSDGSSHGGFGTVNVSGSYNRVGRTSRIINRSNTNTNYTSAAYVSSLDSDGFTLTFTTASIAYGWDFLAFEEDIEAKVLVLPNNTTGSQHLDFGFRPSAVFSTVSPNDAASLLYGFGMTDSNGNSSFNSYRLSGGAGIGINHSEFFRIDETDGNPLVRIGFAGYTNTGVDVVVHNYISGWSQVFLAIGPQVRTKLDAFTTDGVSNVNVGFRPSAVVTQRKQPGGDWNMGIGWSDNDTSQWFNATYGSWSRTENHPNAFLRSGADGRVNYGIITGYTETGYNVNFTGANTTYNSLSIGLSTTDLESQSLEHAHHLDSAYVLQNHILVPASMGHQTAATGIDIDQIHKLLAAPLTHQTTSDTPSIDETEVLTVSGAVHSTDSSSPVFVTGIVVPVNSASHDTLAGVPDITEAHLITIASTGHGTSVESPEVIEAKTLQLQNAMHQVLSERLGLDVTHIVGASSTTHAVNSPTLDLLEQQLLKLQSTIHGVSSPNVAITTFTLLNKPDPAVHSTVVDRISLSQQHSLAVEDILHKVRSGEIRIIKWDDLNVFFGTYKPDYTDTGSLSKSDAPQSGIVKPSHGSVGQLTKIDADSGIYRPTHKDTGKL